MAARKSGGKLSMRDPLPRYVWFVTCILGPETRCGSGSVTNCVVVDVYICITTVIHSALHYAIPFANGSMNAEGGETQNKRPVSTPFGWQRVLIRHAWVSPSDLSNLAWCIKLSGEHSTYSPLLYSVLYLWTLNLDTGQWIRCFRTDNFFKRRHLYPTPDLSGVHKVFIQGRQ